MITNALKADKKISNLEPPFSQFKRLAFSLSGRGGSFNFGGAK
jgi:hypothetical protein